MFLSLYIHLSYHISGLHIYAYVSVAFIIYRVLIYILQCGAGYSVCALSIHLSNHPSILYISICIYIYLSSADLQCGTGYSVCAPRHLSIHLSIHPSIYIYLSISLSISLVLIYSVVLDTVFVHLDIYLGHVETITS